MDERQWLYEIANYFIENESTVRKTAEHFNVGKTRIHNDLTEKLQKEFPALYVSVREILDQNKAEGPRRGGYAMHRNRKLKSKEE